MLWCRGSIRGTGLAGAAALFGCLLVVKGWRRQEWDHDHREDRLCANGEESEWRDESRGETQRGRRTGGGVPPSGTDTLGSRAAGNGGAQVGRPIPGSSDLAPG